MLDIKARGVSDVGKARTGNEDAIAVDEAHGVFVVSDGMGGHGNGEIASKAAVAMVHEELLAAQPVFARFRDDPSDLHRDAALVAFVNAFVKTCAHVYDLGREGQSTGRMGSTLDTILRVGDRVILGHVGDGRIYLVRGEQIYRLTEDHTIIAEQIRAGVVTEADARKSPFLGVLTRAMGTHPSVRVDTLILDLSPGDRLVMCTNGLYQYVDGPALLRLLGPEGGDAGELVAHANAAGGADNISVILLECAPYPAPAQGRAAAPQPAAGAQKATSQVSSRIDAIRRLPLFQYLSYREQVAVLSVTQSRSYGAGDAIVKQGSPGNEMFIVIDGQLVVERDGVKIAELGPGGHFGEMSLVDDAPRSATVAALTATDVLSIGHAELNGLMRMEPALGVKVLWSFVQVLSARLRATSAGLTELQLGDSAPPTASRKPFAPGTVPPPGLAQPDAELSRVGYRGSNAPLGRSST
jgi:serine/threonine protein phosphatase PrpC